MSFVLDASSLRCRSVLNQLFVAVNFATAWRWRPSCEGASKLSWPKSFRCCSIPDLCREVTDLSAASFCLWRPEWLHTGIVKKKKTKKKTPVSLCRSLPFSLSTTLSNTYALFFLLKRKGQGEDLPAAERQIYARSGINLLSCMLSPPSRSERRSFLWRKESTCAKQELWFNKWRIDVAFSSRFTSRRHSGVVARHPSGGGLPFLKGFSLWTNQSKRVYFYWRRPPGPNPVVTMSKKAWAWFEANGSLSLPQAPKSGIPQGIFLGTVLFLLYINDQPRSIPSECSIFADDTSMFKTGRNSQLICSRISEDLSRSTHWANVWGMQFNAEKSEHLIISTNRNDISKQRVLMDNMQIPKVISHKHLIWGSTSVTLFLGKSTSWDQRVGIIRRLIWRSRCSPAVMKKIFISAVQPKLE